MPWVFPESHDFGNVDLKLTIFSQKVNRTSSAMHMRDEIPNTQTWQLGSETSIYSCTQTLLIMNGFSFVPWNSVIHLVLRKKFKFAWSTRIKANTLFRFRRARLISRPPLRESLAQEQHWPISFYRVYPVCASSHERHEANKTRVEDTQWASGLIKNTLIRQTPYGEGNRQSQIRTFKISRGNTSSKCDKFVQRVFLDKQWNSNFRSFANQVTSDGHSDFSRRVWVPSQPTIFMHARIYFSLNTDTDATS